MSPPSASACPVCGAPLDPADAGSCPRCLMLAAMQATGGAERQEPPTVEELSAAFPQFEILGLIGQGGMGCVFKARQKSLNRLVALKLLAPERAGDAAFAMRFAKEAQALAALNHPNIVAVYDFGEAGGFFFLLMEFVDGVNLRQLLRTKRLTPTEALSIVPPVCDALQCAHERGIVHRDIKPENLLLDKTGTVKIADFGIAKLIGEGTDAKEQAHDSSAPHQTMSAGTPAYAAPEQRNGSADHRADIYSLGVVLYEMLTGERPKDRLEPPSRRVQVDVRIDEIVLRALETSPEMRFATVADFRTQVNVVRSSVAARAHWSLAKWAAVIVAGLAAAGVGYSVIREEMRKPSVAVVRDEAAPEIPPPASSPGDAIAELEKTYDALLDEERAAALERDVAPDRRQRRDARIRELRERAAALERLVERFTEPSPNPSTPPRIP